ncbi:MAG: hypothetical protein AAF937_10440 [Planctomycetota bacterium]
MNAIRLLGAATAAALAVSPTLAQFSYDELADGDITGDRFAPLELPAADGVNTLSGTVVDGDIDYFRFTVPAGSELVAINLADYQSPDFAAFLGVQQGSTFTVDPDNPTPDDLLGFVLYGPPAVGTDVLPAIGSAFGAIGFSGFVPAGDYVFWNQQTGPDLTSFTFDFVIRPIPAPASAALFGVGGLLASRRRR